MRDQIARLQYSFALRSGSGNEVELCYWNGSLALYAIDVNHRIERYQCNVLVRGVARNAVLASTEDRQHTVVAGNGGTAGAGFALVTWGCCVSVIDAARRLQQVSSSC